jgi:hypothetical protein
MIVVISDSHDNLANLKKVASFVREQKVETIIHCGDIASLDVLKDVFGDFKGEIHAVLGNLDIDRDFPMKVKNFPQLKIYSGYGELEKMAFTHFPQKAKELAKSGKYEIVFYGHTHKPWEETINKTKVVNPGNIAGLIYRASFATYKNRELKLIIL